MLVKNYKGGNCNSMYVTILWVLVERVKKHDPVLNISRIFSASHFSHVLFLHEPQGIRAGKNVSKDTYQSKFFWSQQVLTESFVKPSAVLGTLDIAKEAYRLTLCSCFCFLFKLKLNGSTDSSCLSHQVPHMLESSPKCVLFLLCFVNIEFRVILCSSH